MYHFISRNTETGEVHEKDIAHERDAVNAWCQATLYANIEPVSVTPEPDWDAYTHDGKTPCGSHPNRKEAA